jgi:hypothetical protein
MTADGKVYTDSTNVDCLFATIILKLMLKLLKKAVLHNHLDFNAIAQSVGKPKLSNCGVCHFYGGGGNNVKHGDLDMAMFETTKDVDVHMGVDGGKLQCVDCHTTEQHNISGKVYSLSSMNHE